MGNEVTEERASFPRVPPRANWLAANHSRSDAGGHAPLGREPRARRGRRATGAAAGGDAQHRQRSLGSAGTAAGRQIRVARRTATSEAHTHREWRHRGAGERPFEASLLQHATSDVRAHGAPPRRQCACVCKHAVHPRVAGPGPGRAGHGVPAPVRQRPRTVRGRLCRAEPGGHFFLVPGHPVRQLAVVHLRPAGGQPGEHPGGAEEGRERPWARCPRTSSAARHRLPWVGNV